MGRASRGKVITATGATVAAALATGGVALASDGAAPEIHGCVNDATGALRIARHCASGEHPVAWNQRGPAGPQGFRGPPGPSPAGSGGPAAWTVTQSSPVLIGTSPTPVLTAPSLPASASGTNYVVSAVVSVQDVSSGSINVTCTLSLGSQSYPDTLSSPGATGAVFRQSSLNLALGAQITSAQAPSLSCVLNAGSDSLTIQRAELTVIQAGALS
jgi:hypothetical protein